MRFSLTDCKKMVDEIEEKYPEIIASTYNRIRKVEAHYKYLFTLSLVLRAYCAKRGLRFNDENDHDLRGSNISPKLKQERSLFIAVSLWLFSPSVYKIGKRNVKVRNEFKKEMVPIYKAEDGIRHHLSGILGCHESIVSNLVNPIASAYHERNQDFKNTVDSVVKYVKDNVREEYIEPEQGEGIH